MSKDRLGQEGRDEPEYPNFQISSQGDPILGPTPLNRVRLPYPNRTHWPRWIWPLDLVARQEVVMGEVACLQMDLDQPQWRAQDRDTEGDPARTDIKDRLDETRWIKPDTYTPPGDIFLTGFAQVALGDSSLDGLTGLEIEWTQLNFIIPF